MDIGMSTELKVELNPKDHKAVYSQSLHMSIHLEEDLIVELALMHKYGIITVLPFSKYASPTFAKRKPSGKLRFLVHLRKTSSLIADDCTNNNHPVSTWSDAAQHLAGKSLFFKLDCSRAYHCLQMADQRSTEMLAFNFASRTFAYKRLAQGLSRSVSAFSNFQREYLAQLSKLTNVFSTRTTPEMQPPMLRTLPGTSRQSSSAFARQDWSWQEKSATSESKEVEFFGTRVSPEGISSQVRKIQNFLDQLTFPKSWKAPKLYLEFVNYYRNYIPRMAEELNPFNKLPKTEVPINIRSETKETFDSINKALSDACELVLKQPIPGKQLVLIMDAGFGSAGYALMIEDNPDQKIVKTENIRPRVVWLETFLPCATQYVHIFRGSYENINGISSVCTHFVGNIKANNCSDRWKISHMFLPDESNSTTTVECMWLCVSNQLQNTTQRRFSEHCGWFSLQTGAQSHAEDSLKIREQIQTTPIEVTTSSSDVAEAEQFFFTQVENENESEEQSLERKEQSRQNAKQWVAYAKPSSLKQSERVYKDPRKHYVVFHDWNQGKWACTSRARCRSSLEESKIDNFRPTTWRRTNNDRPTIQALQGKWRSQCSQRWSTVRKNFGETDSVK